MSMTQDVTYGRTGGRTHEETLISKVAPRLVKLIMESNAWQNLECTEYSSIPRDTVSGPLMTDAWDDLCKGPTKEIVEEVAYPFVEQGLSKVYAASKAAGGTDEEIEKNMWDLHRNVEFDREGKMFMILTAPTTEAFCDARFETGLRMPHERIIWPGEEEKGERPGWGIMAPVPPVLFSNPDVLAAFAQGESTESMRESVATALAKRTLDKIVNAPMYAQRSFDASGPSSSGAGAGRSDGNRATLPEDLREKVSLLVRSAWDKVPWTEHAMSLQPHLKGFFESQLSDIHEQKTKARLNGRGAPPHIRYEASYNPSVAERALYTTPEAQEGEGEGKGERSVVAVHVGPEDVTFDYQASDYYLEGIKKPDGMSVADLLTRFSDATSKKS